MKRILSVLLPALCVCCCFILVGCDDSSSTEPEPELYIAPTTADAVMLNFITAMTQMDKDAFETLLDTDFEFVQEIDDAVITQDWYRADELIFLNNFFLGEPFLNSAGETVDPVNAITLTLDGSMGDWVTSDRPEFPSTTENPCWKRQYGVVFDVAQPNRTMEVRNDAVFFVTRVSDGEGGWLYSIRGQMEVPQTKDLPETTWGSIRDLYR